jgi:hypothetical protein
METGNGTGGKRLTQAVALIREAVVTQTKKPGKTRISEKDWNKYVDAVRRNTAQGHDEETRKGKGD